ncbi:trypsin-like peptidase domain-containing protein [Streptomyces sp. A7024]|uniref:Trypsin-like peptidase domain-containing protein n=1 Tax=Streptomyces coryli TaxID=1128680 RepID=A0A6G4U756_9ACTN|nr:trypsin-like peptidase domain-containing protein [Streptomyces coryli]NGN68014.1 trypsin-like peptidase domain-containing protein [Streptomyces coryli]
MNTDYGWRARIDSPEGATLGAGFLVDDQRLLTCAHVVQGRDSVLVTFPGRAQALPASVVWRGDWAATGDRGDVAVLMLSTAVRIAPCRLADPMSTAWARSSSDAQPARLTALGFPRGHKQNGINITLCGQPGNRLGDEWTQLTVLDDPGIDSGFSGAAVYDADGMVIGMVTDAVLGGGAGGRVGKALPLDSLRRHWEELDDLLPLEWLGHKPRQDLRGLLAGTAACPQLSGLVKEALPNVRQVPDTFESVWAAVRYVGEQGWAQDRLQMLLRALLPYVPDARTAGGITDWLSRWFPHSSAAQDLSAHQCSIIVRLEPLTRGARLELHVSTLVNGIPVRQSDPCRVRRDDIRRKVEALLPAHVRQVHDRNWMLEFAVPQDLMDIDYEEWRLKEEGVQYPRPLRQFPMVIRDVARLRPITPAQEARNRWAMLRERGRTDPIPVSCERRENEEQFASWLIAEKALCALAYSVTPRADLLRAALGVGVPIILWRRQVCPGEDHSSCDRNAILAQLTESLAAVDPDKLPWEVRRLRNQAHAQVSGAEDHCGHRLTLLWDDPARHPEPPLAMEGA